MLSSITKVLLFSLDPRAGTLSLQSGKCTRRQPLPPFFLDGLKYLFAKSGHGWQLQESRPWCLGKESGGLGKEWGGLGKECILSAKSEFSWAKKNASLLWQETARNVFQWWSECKSYHAIDDAMPVSSFLTWMDDSGRQHLLQWHCHQLGSLSMDVIWMIWRSGQILWSIRNFKLKIVLVPFRPSPQALAEAVGTVWVTNQNFGTSQQPENRTLLQLLPFRYVSWTS